MLFSPHLVTPKNLHMLMSTHTVVFKEITKASEEREVEVAIHGTPFCGLSIEGML